MSDIVKKLICLTCIITILFSGISVQAAIEQPVSFLQDDSEWGFESYSVKGRGSQTIATSGCGPTAMAMVLNYYIDDSITPLQTAMYAMNNNHRTKNDGTSWEYFEDMANEYDLEFFQTASSSEALEWIDNKENALIICSMKRGLWTSSGHYILVWDVDKDGKVYINDPNSTEQKKTVNSYRYMASQCKQYFCFNKKPKELASYPPIIKTVIVSTEEQTFSFIERLMQMFA